MSTTPKVRTCLWLLDRAEEAAEYYVSLLPGSRVDSKVVPEAGKPALAVEVTLCETPYMLLNGGPHYTLSPAASIAVRTDTQAETDRLWDALLADGGEQSRCGWLVDRFGVSWQIVPEALPRLLFADDPATAARVREAMFTMNKLDIDVLEAAFRGE